MKKLLLFSLLAVSLTAGQYARLKDGTVIILKEDGTWEKVRTLPEGESAAASVSTADAAQTPSVDPVASEYAQKLVGVWSSDDGHLKYIVGADGTATIVEGRKKRTGRYKIQKVHPEKREFLFNLGETGSAGFFSFGGVMRKLVFSEDFRSFVDRSASIPTELSKVK